ncbi:hypothetical protein FC40_GL001507 [Ligilactobacillus hayakitensis DSM 18933 = JCM 14209]|uniref:Uncharacterized protein n=1 Tax=Ligilactobacillus hayakitensis DSM 18933 = JCM 14209 TaxID=1423755 RepID=A0A0R1WP02_9LACO|nr:hypothetical protein FC40_GL001507 [Ligilactobacillus hayakitensis DSM 18933 = JCM 14209]
MDFVAPAMALVKKMSDSPGKNGKMTNPVSAKTIRNKMTYDQGPMVLIMACKNSLRCVMKKTI